MSYGHVELVYQRSTHQGAAHQVLAYLALRANENHICWPGNDKMAADLRISKRSVAYAIRDLSEAGDILQVRQGNGRGKASTWQLGHQYRPTNGEEAAPFEPSKGETVSPFEAINDAYTAPFDNDEPEKGANPAQKGATVAERVQSATQKGATIAPQRNKNNNKERKENGGGRSRTRAPARAAPAGAGEYEALWYEHTGTWLGTGLEEFLREQLGPSPRWELVRTASGRYRARGYRATDAEGICDWYHNLAADPNWVAPARYTTRTPAGATGASPVNQPKTFGQIREESNKAAAEEFKRLIRQGANHGTP